nr:nck-associated protein 5-like [Mirounga angustirostris]
MSEAMDQPAGSPGKPRPGEGGDSGTEPGTCQELLHRLRELEVGHETGPGTDSPSANSASPLQIPLAPLQPPSELPASPSLSSAEGPTTPLPLGHCAGQREVCWEQQLRPGGPGPPGPPAAPPPALDALSPFLRKKAQILEVLRALEETDPLLLCSPATPWRPPGEGPGSPEPINGELCGPPQPEPSSWAPYLLLGPGSLGGLLHWERLLGGPGEEEGAGRPWGPGRGSSQAQGTGSGPPCAPGSSSSSSSDEAGDPNEAPSPDTLLGALARKQLNLGQLLEDTESYLQAFLAGAAGPLNGDQPGPGQPSSPDQGPPQLSKSKGLPKSAWGGGTPEAHRPGFGATSEGQGPLPFLSMFMGAGDAPLGLRPGHPYSSSQVKSKLQIGPPSPGEVQGPLLPSPARGLKFLKLPPASEKVPSPGGPQLSPQLPRNSRIPCRHSGSDGSPSPLLARRGLSGGELSPEGAQGLPTSPSPCSAALDSARLRAPQPALSTTLSPGPVVSPCYENILDLSRSTFRGPSPEPPPSPLQVPTYPQLTLEVPRAPEVLRSPGAPSSPCLPESCSYGNAQEKSLDKAGSESPHPGRRTPSSSSKKPSQGAGRRPGDPGYTPLRDRLAALGKLKTGPEGPEKNGVPARPGTEKVRGAGRSAESPGDVAPPTPRPPEGPEAKGALRGAVALGTSSLKQQDPGLLGDPGARVYSSHSMGARVDLEPVSPRSCLTKVELAKSRLAGALCPQVPRTPAKVPTSAPSLGKPNKSPHGSPTKLPSKSPTKVVPRPGAPPTTKEPPKPDKGKGPPWADCSGGAPAQPPSPAPGPADPSQGPDGRAPHSAIEEKVMKGIEENVLRLQGQERAPGAEAKHRNASSIASWFGLKKSKLPALNRRAEAAKSKEAAGGGSPLRKEVKVEARKLEAESLNISKLMAKAEDLRRALEEEKAYLSSRARPRPGGPAPGPSTGLGQVQGQLAGMYQGADTFMQQLLNRVDGKELPPKNWREPKPEYGDFHQPVSSDPKNPWPACGPRNGLVGPLQSCGKPPGKPNSEPGRREEMPSEDSLAEPVPTSHFTACGSLTRTLDSGIGTFPPPDHGSNGTPSKNLPKTKPPRLDPPPGVPPARPPPLTKVPRRAHTLEREVPGIEELLVSGRHPSMSAFPALLTAAPGHRGHQTCPDDPCEDPGPPPPVQLAKNWTFPNARAANSSADPFLCPSRQLEGLPRNPMALPMDQKRSLEPSHPAPTPQGPAFGGSRTPSTSDVGEEGRVASGGPPGLETSESLSDSLYDSLSSCGSQG